jgi:hypothetical protein
MSYQTTEDKIRRVNQCIKKKVNFISGTITPCQSNKYENKIYEQSDIETLDVGLKYLFDMYSKDLKLSIQPKYMGSRLNIYLFRENTFDNSYGITRNGFLCRLSKEQMKPIYQKLIDKLGKYMEENKIKMMLLDGELMPWSAIGKSLIEDEFIPVSAGLKKEIEYMEKYNFDNILTKQKEKFNENKSSDDYKKFKLCEEFHTTDTMKKMFTTYQKQMELYTKQVSEDNPIDYKPFGILKICYNDGSEDIPLLSKSISQGDMYDLLSNKENSSENQLRIHITEETYDKSLEEIKQFFDNITMENGYEGIMLKPEFVEKDKLHMMKCRNIEYLTIIYGYDYMIGPKLTRLIKSKTTGNKIKQSINEYKTGIKMLETKYDDITMQNTIYQELLMKFIYDEEYGKTIDPRL